MAINVYEDIAQLNILGNSSNDLQTLHICIDFILIKPQKMTNAFKDTFIRYYGALSPDEANKKAKEWTSKLLQMQKNRQLLNLNQSGFIASDNEIITEEEPNLDVTPNSNGSTMVVKMANVATQKVKITPNPFPITFMFALAQSGSVFDVVYISNQSDGQLYQSNTGEVVTISNSSQPYHKIYTAIIKQTTSFIAGSDTSVEFEIKGSGVQQKIQKSIYNN